MTKLIGLFLIAATLIVFWQVRNHEFINFDDNEYITENTMVRAGLTREGVAWAFTYPTTVMWHPLTWLSLMVDSQLFGLNPAGFHLTNLFFHVANTLLLFLILLRATGSPLRCGFVAALFALHPLHVESVAWATERKDVLSAFFWFLTIWTYIRYVEQPTRRTYGLALLFFTLGLLSKPMVVTLPFVLLLLDYWPLRRIQNDSKLTVSRLALEKAPFFALTLISSALIFFNQQSTGGLRSSQIWPLWTRTGNALISYVEYIGKTIWPQNLSVFYPYVENLPTLKVFGCGLLLIGLSVLFIRSIKTKPWLAIGWCWYLGTLVPVIGLAQIGTQSIADRYMYLPSIGLFIMMAWSLPMAWPSWITWRHRHFVLFITAGAILTTLIRVSWLQTQHWQNSVTLFEHALQVTTNNALAHNNLGNALLAQGQTPQAIEHLLEALRIEPNAPTAHVSLGVALANQGQFEEATTQVVEAVRLEPSYAIARNNLGGMLSNQGQYQEAITHYIEAIRIKPDYANAHYNLGVAFAKIGNESAALAEYKTLETLNPELANTLHRQILK